MTRRLALAAATAAALTVTLLSTANPAAAAQPAAAPTTAAVQASNKVPADTHKAVQRKLKRLGFRTVAVTGTDSQEFRNILCAWREVVGKTEHRGRLLAGEADRILATTTLPAPRDHMVTGLNVNLRCQSVYIVDKVKKQRVYDKIFRASTGGINGLTTSTGTFTIQRRIDGLHNSTSYPEASGWNMYRPAYFTSWGEAFHGSPSDSSVHWYPATHGCVRMVQRDIDYLWDNGYNTIGTTVHIYNQWQG